MALMIISRTGWGAQPPKSRTPWPNGVAALEGICQHWFGTPKAASSHDGCAALLRSVQRSHMAPGGLGVPTGGSDIAYNLAVCPHGIIYSLRGWDIQTGANGTMQANRTLLAVVYMAGTGDPLTAKGRDSLIALYQEAFRKGIGVKAVGHGSISGSECPGPQLRNFLASGVWRPAPVRPKVRYRLMNGEGKPIGTESTAFEPGTVDEEVAVVKRWLVTKARGVVVGTRADGDITIRRRKV